MSIVDLNFIGIGPKKCFTCVFTVFTDICPKKFFLTLIQLVFVILKAHPKTFFG